MNLPFLAQRLFNVPLAIRAEKAEIILAALAERLGIMRVLLPNGSMRAFDGDGIGFEVEGVPNESRADAGYDVVNGVAIIEVFGTLVQRQMGLRPFSGM